MKMIFFVLLFLAALVHIAHAQGGTRRDTIGFAAWKRAVMKAPVLTGETEARIIVPHEQPLCFNTEFDLKLTVGSKIVEQAMFINSSIGITGYLPPSDGGLVNMLFPELVDFSFFIIGLKGNVYHYYNSKGKDNRIEHWVSTGNTDVHQYQQMGTDFTAAVTLDRKNVTGPYCQGTITAMAYRFTSNPGMTWYVYGDRFPVKLHPKKFLGNFGIGYLQCTEGLYLVTEIQSPGYSCKVSDIQNTYTCLFTTVFNIKEDAFIASRTTELQKEKDRLERQAGRISGDCAAEQTNLLSFRQEQQRKQEANLAHLKDGNVHQDIAVQRRMLSMMDPLTMVQESILTTRLGICQALKSAQRGGPGAAAAQEKANCLSGLLGQLQQLETQMQALNTQYATEPGRAYAEKSKLYAQRRPRGCG